VTTLTASVEIDASAEHTWQVVTDWQRQGEWIPFTDVTVLADSPIGLGARISARSGVGPIGVVDPMIVDVWQPPYRCEVVHLGRIVSGRGVFEVESLAAGRSKFTWSEVLDPAAPHHRIERFGAPATKVMLGVAVRRLAKLVTAEPQQSAEAS
jgi:Polyketide cyclase / dehydrase and lipid transport